MVNTLARDKAVLAMTMFGCGASRIAEELHVSERTVVRIRKRIGCSRPVAAPLTDSELAAARRLLEDGCSYTEAARTIGRSDGTLRRVFPGYSWSKSQVGQYAALCREVVRKVLG